MTLKRNLGFSSINCHVTQPTNMNTQFSPPSHNNGLWRLLYADSSAIEDYLMIRRLRDNPENSSSPSILHLNEHEETSI